MQRPCGSTFPAPTVTQWPGELARSQLRQVPVQALSQQTPSTQKFEAHSLAPLQLWPGVLGPQLLLTQAVPTSQSPPVWHEVVQAPSTQAKG